MELKKNIGFVAVYTRCPAVFYSFEYFVGVRMQYKYTPVQVIPTRATFHILKRL